MDFCHMLHCPALVTVKLTLRSAIMIIPEVFKWSSINRKITCTTISGDSTCITIQIY